MHVVSQTDLPFHGMSHEFVGAEHGGVAASIYFVESPPGRKTRLHRHPYDEIAIVRAGRGRWTVDGEQREAGPGDILIVKAGQVHGFENIGDIPLEQIDVHLSERFIQENLD
ncbi:MAG TPA: cupin domain-containing protein [Gemmatimonadaceae bacterium]|nr:cupin domain-containing protein [Gemmatimonadaceae bacterium]